MPQDKFPTRGQLLLPLLEALHEAGGQARPSEAYDRVAEKVGLDPARRRLRGVAGKAGEINLWERHVRNARQSGTVRGLIDGETKRNLWALTEKGSKGLQNCSTGVVITVFESDLGTALWAEAEDAVSLIADDTLDLILTSPPYPLQTQKSYGNRSDFEHVEWLTALASRWKDKLKETGSLVLNLADVFQKGRPALSLYQERLLLKLVDDLGFSLAERFYWENPSKMPAPAEWVCVRRIRCTPSVENFYWLTKSDRARADNRRVLRPYSESMRRRLKEGGERTRSRRPSGHMIAQGAFSRDNGGSIPHNLLVESHSHSNDRYQQRCRALGLPIHPARWPEALVTFFVEFLTTPGDRVYDPFSGSCMTSSVCERLGRQWIASERSLTYLRGGATRFEENPHARIAPGLLPS